MTELLVVRNLTRRFGNHTVLDGVSFRPTQAFDPITWSGAVTPLPKGGISAGAGPSGSGSPSSGPSGSPTAAAPAA